MKYLSLFSGIGGFELGMPGFECVGFSEIDRHAIQIYKRHFPRHNNYGDITKITIQELPEFDLVCGGFPCQSFSIAGKRGGFEDTRGTLFFEIARIARAKRPRYLFLENVRGILSHDESNTFATIISTIDELGYDVQWQVVNSSNHGVPQGRERVFIVGHLRGTPGPKIFPIEGKDFEGEEVCNEIMTVGYFGRGKPFGQNSKIYHPFGLAPTITTSVSSVPSVVTRKDGQNIKTKEELDNVPHKVKEWDRDSAKPAEGPLPEEAPEGGPGEPGLREQDQQDSSVHRRLLLARVPKALPGAEDEQRILGAEDRGEPPPGQEEYQESQETWLDRHKDLGARIREGIRMGKLGARYLTPLECERLQGFPDGWTEYGMDEGRRQIKVSDAQRYKVLGNAVTVDVIRAIAQKL